MIHYVVPRQGAFTFQYFIEDWAGPAADRFAIIPAEEFVQRTSFEPGTYVFAVDDIEPAERRLFVHLWDQLAGASPRTRVLNDPARTLGRLQLLHAMAGVGRNDFRAVSASEWPVSVRYPVFIRDRERHNGALTPLLLSPAEVARRLRWFEWKGYRREDLLVVEYCETADVHGVYRKYSAYVVGDRIIPRCIEFGAQWMVKHDIRMFDEARLREEQEYVEGNPHEVWLREIFALANITYGRADYTLKGGAPQLFEINLNPTVGRFRPKGEDPDETLRLRAKRRATAETFYAAFNAAWAALDAETTGSDPLTVTADPDLAAAAARERRVKTGRDRRRAGIERLTSNSVLAATIRMFKRIYLGHAGR